MGKASIEIEFKGDVSAMLSSAGKSAASCAKAIKALKLELNGLCKAAGGFKNLNLAQLNKAGLAVKAGGLACPPGVYGLAWANESAGVRELGMPEERWSVISRVLRGMEEKAGPKIERIYISAANKSYDTGNIQSVRIKPFSVDKREVFEEPISRAPNQGATARANLQDEKSAFSHSDSGLASFADSIKNAAGAIGNLADANEKWAGGGSFLSKLSAITGTVLPVINLVVSLVEYVEQTEKRIETIGNQAVSFRNQIKEAYGEIELNYTVKSKSVQETQRQFDNLWAMIERGAGGSGLDFAVQTLIDRLPEASQYVKKINGEWRLMPGNIQKAIEAQLLIGEMGRLDDKLTRLDADREVAVKKRDEMQAALIGEYGGQISNRTRDRSIVARYESKYSSGMYRPGPEYEKYAKAQFRLNFDYRELEAQEKSVREMDATIGGIDAEKRKTQDELDSLIYQAQPAAGDKPFSPGYVEPFIEACAQFGKFADDLKRIEDYIGAGDYASAAVWASNDEYATRRGAAKAFDEDKTGLSQAFAKELLPVVEQLKTNYLDQLTLSEKGIFDETLSALNGVVAGKAEDIEQVFGWLKTWKLPLDVTVKVLGEKVQVSSPYMSASDGNAGKGAPPVDRSVPKKALGTSFWKGGYVQVDEKGGEVKELPRGAKIYPAQKTEQIIREDFEREKAPAPNVSVQVTMTGNTWQIRSEEDVRSVSGEMADRIAELFSSRLRRAALNVG